MNRDNNFNFNSFSRTKSSFSSFPSAGTYGHSRDNGTRYDERNQKYRNTFNHNQARNSSHSYYPYNNMPYHVNSSSDPRNAKDVKSHYYPGYQKYNSTLDLSNGSRDERYSNVRYHNEHVRVHPYNNNHKTNRGSSYYDDSRNDIRSERISSQIPKSSSKPIHRQPEKFPENERTSTSWDRKRHSHHYESQTSRSRKENSEPLNKVPKPSMPAEVIINSTLKETAAPPLSAKVAHADNFKNKTNNQVHVNENSHKEKFDRVPPGQIGENKKPTFDNRNSESVKFRLSKEKKIEALNKIYFGSESEDVGQTSSDTDSEKVEETMPFNGVPIENLQSCEEVEAQVNNCTKEHDKSGNLFNKISDLTAEKCNVQQKDDFKIENNLEYQIKLTLITLKNNSINENDFSVLKNERNPENLSDIVYCRDDGNVANLFMIKCVDPKITCKNKIILDTFRKIFNIKSIYKSYLNYKKTIGKEIDAFYIVSNIELDRENFLKNKILVVADEKSFQIKPAKNAYIFTSLLAQNSDIFQKIAKDLSDSIDHNSPVRFNKIFADYHLALIEEKILEVWSKKGIYNNKFGKFTKNFIDGQNLSNSARKLREECIKKFGTLHREIEFTLSTKFGTISVGNVLPLKLPENIESKETVTEFYEKLKFSVFTENIDSFLLNNIGPEFRMINSENIVNINADLLKCFHDSDSNLLETYKNTVSKSIILNNNIKKPLINIEFEPDLIKDLRSRLKFTKQNKIILLKSDSTILSTQKIKELIKNYHNYSNNNCIFINFESITNSGDMCTHIYNACKIVSTKLLVLECDKLFKKVNNMAEICNKLKKIIELKKSINIIIAGNYEGFPYRFKDKSCEDELQDRLNGFNDLTINSQKKLFEELKVSLHGQKLKIQDLMDFNTFFELISIKNIFFQIIKEICVIGKKIIISNNYVDRYLERHIIISKSIFNTKNSDIFLIENIEKINFKNLTGISETDIDYLNDIDGESENIKKIILLNTKDEQFNLDNFIKQNQIKRNIHFLKYQSDEFVWQKSSGSFSLLFKHRKENSKNNQILLIPKENFSIICGEPGFGKSTYLNKLEEMYHNSCNFPVWSMRINLNNSMMSELEKETFKNKEFAFSFLKKQLFDQNFDASASCYKLYPKIKAEPMSSTESESDSDSELHQLNLQSLNQTPGTYFWPTLKKMFAMCYNGELKLKLALFFDNIDELHPSNMGTAIKLLKQLKNSDKIKIFMTSSLKFKYKLESELGLFCYSLGPLSHEDKKKILLASLEKNNKEIFADKILEFYSSKEVDLTSNPLTLNMLAVINRSSILYNSLTMINSIDNHYLLYKKFVEDCLPDTDECYKEQSSALRKLISPDRNLFSLQEDKIDSDFHHVTFVEFFAAQYLANKLSKENEYTTIKEFCDHIECLIKYRSPIFISSLANLLELNDESKAIKYFKLFVKSNCPNTLKELLNYQKISINLEKSLLHIASAKGHLRIVKFFCERNSNDHYFFDDNEISKKTALQTAVECENFEVACELLLQSAGFTDLKKELLVKVIVYIASELSKSEPGQLHKLHPIAEKLFLISPESVIRNENLNFPRLLNYFFINGRTEIIKILMEQEKDLAEKFFKPDDYGNSPLYYVNSSNLLTDEKRLEITKLLRDHVYDSKQKSEIVRSIIEASIRCRHLKTFKYFLHEFSVNGYDGFLRTCLRENRKDHVLFLLNNKEQSVEEKTGNTVLHTALKSKASFEMIRFILTQGGMNNIKNLKKQSPLCIALKENVDIKIIKYLVDKGADPNAEDETGIFAWCYAIIGRENTYSKDEQLALYKFFFEENPIKAINLPSQGKNSLFDRFKKEVEMKQEYLNNIDNYDLNYLDKDKKCTRLHQAIVRNNDLYTTWAKFLIKFGADVNIKENGLTVLELSLKRKNYIVAMYLLNAKAIINDCHINVFKKNEVENEKYYKQVKKLLQIEK